MITAWNDEERGSRLQATTLYIRIIYNILLLAVTSNLQTNAIKISIVLNLLSNVSINKVTSINSISQSLTYKLNTIKIITLSKSLGEALINRVGHLIKWSMTLKVINKINSRLKFLRRKKQIFNSRAMRVTI